MKRVIALTAATLMSGALFAAPALAQVSVDTGVNAGVSAGGETGAGTAGGTATGTLGADTQIKSGAAADTGANANIDTGATASIGGSWDGLMSSMGDTGASASLGSMSDVGNVTVVKVSSLDNADMDAFAKAKADNQASIDNLHSAIDANAKVKAALDAQGVASSDVVAANVAADGSLTVYVE